MAALQITDLNIIHDRLMNLIDYFYFGVSPNIFLSFDQSISVKRNEEKRFGYQMDILNFSKKELKEKVNKIMYVDLSFDDEVSVLIKKLKPDYLLCDLVYHMPSLIEFKIPYSFIISCNPLILNHEDFPLYGIGQGIDQIKEIKSAREEFKEIFDFIDKKFQSSYKKLNINFQKKYPVYSPRSDNFSFYIYPKELDYFNEKIKKEYNLLQVDSPVVLSRIPLPYRLSEEFAELPRKIIYVSLGSLFNYYYVLLQKLIDSLANLPYKYIISKGQFGDKIKFPNNHFIGENFVDQLAVLQVADMMIAHGGNNTFTECFYFGVPAIIVPVMGDQMNNAKRIEETEFGLKMNIMNYTQEELKEKIEKVLLDEILFEKIKKVGERIRKEKSLDKAVKNFYESIKDILRTLKKSISNAKRIEETGFGYQMDLMNYTVEELKDKINKILSDKSLIEKTKKVGERIRKDNSIEKAVKFFYESLEKNLK
uniref:UDP-glycosyltransferase n=1 Tax=Polyphagotarsonemus latus TaxID=1204166 RepID=A0AAN0LP44_9ACAR